MAVNSLKVLILAGGKGVRLWPYSTERLPKQFLTIKGRESSFVQAVKRALAVSASDDVFITTNAANVPHVKRQLRNTGLGFDHVIVKDDDYETGLSIYFSLKRMKEEFSMRDDDIVAVMPSDHFIKPLEDFKRSVRDATNAAAKGFIVALGKKPEGPQESFGYMLLDKKNPGEYFRRITRFVEKPSRAVAEELIKEGSLWNLGIYVFPIGLALEEFAAQLKKGDEVSGAFDVSFDKMIAEKSKQMAAVEATFEWLDMGSWKAFRSLSDKDEKKNANLDDHILVNTEDSLVMGSEKPIVAIHLDNVLVVDHEDALLIVPENQVDVLKKAMPAIKEKHPRLMKGLPFVSICTVLDDEESFDATLESVLAQSYPFIEYIIIDRRGAQKSEALQARVQAMKDRLAIKGEKVVDIIADPGGPEKVFEALNKAIEESTGEIVGLLNAGDAYADSAVIQTMVDAMEREGADVSWGDLVYVGRDQRQMKRFWQSSPHRQGIFKSGWMPPNPTFFAKKWIFEKYGYFRTDMPVSSTYEFMLRVLEKEGVKGCYIPKIMVKVRESGVRGFKKLAQVTRGNLEAYRAWKVNGLHVRLWFMFRKPLSKLDQLFRKSRPIKLQ